MKLHHHDHAEVLTSLNASYYISMALNFGFVIVEAGVGIAAHSMGLLSGAGHKLFDVFWLFLAMLAFKLAKSRPDKKFTYGHRKTSILIALINSLILFAAVCVVIYESILKFSSPSPVNGTAISWTAGAGIIVSGVSALLMMQYQKKDINTRGVFLHMSTDALVSAGMVVSGIVINLTGLNVIDPIISLAISVVILYNTVKLMISSFRMSIDGVPENIDYDEIENIIRSREGVENLSELRIWPVSITETALTVHLVVSRSSDRDKVVALVRKSLSDRGISLITIETEEAAC